MQPLLSVIVLAFRQEAYLNQCLNAVEEIAKLDGVEVVLAEDFGGDQCRRIMQDRLKDFPKVKTVFPDENLGHCRIFNRALELTSGAFVWDLAADDIPRPKAIEALLPILKAQAYNGKLIVANANSFQDGEPLTRGKSYFGKTRPYPKGNYLWEAIRGNRILAAAMFMPSRELKKLGGYNQNLSFEDYDITIRLAAITEALPYPEVVIDKRITPTGSHTLFFSTTNANHLKSVRLVLEALDWQTIKSRPALVDAWATSAKYHYRLCLRTGHQNEALAYKTLLKSKGLFRIYEQLWWWVGLAKGGLTI